MRRRMSPIGSEVVRAFEGFAAPEREGRFECLRFAVGVSRGEKLVELVEVNASPLA